VSVSLYDTLGKDSVGQDVIYFLRFIIDDLAHRIYVISYFDGGAVLH